MGAQTTSTNLNSHAGDNGAPPSPWRDLWLTVRDGLKLYGRHYPAPGSRRRPVLCLAGLTRNSRDFHKLAIELSGDGADARDVYTFDCRGRGQSEHARQWQDYAVPIEMFDVQDFMAAHQLHQAGIVGTSRGGLITMVLAAAQPSLVGPVVLNDIGPVIDRDGLLRISGYVGRTPVPSSWDDAARMLAQANQAHFPEISGDEWREVARQWFNEANGRPAPGYDPKIARSFSVKEGAIPALWPQFGALKRSPCLVIRGALSDLLSEATVAQMQRLHPRLATFTVEQQGHAPLLRDDPSMARIKRFFAEHD
ncbi:MAG: alpha/beta hydrolase [Hyphomicrobiaceae bacterium]|nr:alpha/beta hydrolase [Hyphomicrobiaceae bacterium]